MGLDALIPDDQPRRDDTAQPLMAGTVIDTATGVNDEVRVRLDVDRDHTLPPAPFMPRVKERSRTIAGDTVSDYLDLVLPEAGDPCLVGFDEVERPYIVWWKES